MKKVLGFIIVGLICGLGFLVWLYASTLQKKPVDNDGTPFDPFVFESRPPIVTSTLPVVIDPNDTQGIRQGQIGKVTIEELLRDPETYADPYNTGQYYLGNRLPAFEDTATFTPPYVTTIPPYVIVYIEDGQFFNVSLLAEPIGQARAQAEQYLMSKFGLTADQLCQLNYMVTVPWYVNETYAGTDLRFSSCVHTTFLP